MDGMMPRAKIRDEYEIINRFPFVIGILYIAKRLSDDQTCFLHALEEKWLQAPVKSPSDLGRTDDVFSPSESCFSENGVFYLVYDKIKGHLLAYYLKKHMPLTLTNIAECITRIAAQLIRLYEKKSFTVIHPQNILLQTREDRTEIQYLYGGSLEVLPKGIATGNKLDIEAAEAYDSYSLGVLTYQMVSGKHPMAEHLTLPPLSKWLADCPSELDRFIIDACSFDQDKRPKLEEFNEAFSPFIR